jgi:uncharacterized protein (TIGR03435 family)
MRTEYIFRFFRDGKMVAQASACGFLGHAAQAASVRYCKNAARGPRIRIPVATFADEVENISNYFLPCSKHRLKPVPRFWGPPMRTEAREMLAVGMLGGQSNIGNRIEMLLRKAHVLPAGTSIFRLVVSAAALCVMALAASLAPRWIAFAEQTALSFEVASIHPNRSGSTDSIVNLPSTGRLEVTNATIKTLVQNAWGIQPLQITGGPAWVDTTRFDIKARTARAITPQEEPMVLQNLLVDRFHLKTHWTTLEAPVYDLVPDKGGPKFTQNTGPASSTQTSRGPEGVHLQAKKMPVAYLARMLGKQVGRVVEDKTQLSGYYDFDLIWDPQQTQESAAPSIFTALQTQLGLKLRSSRDNVPAIVIDQVEQPDAN